MSDDEDDVDGDGAHETETTNVDPSYRRQTAIPKLLEGSEVTIFLEQYGFPANTAMHWRGTPPELSITVSGHSVTHQKTWYHLDCSLATGKEPLQWRAALRLKHLRKGLHDLVKPQLGSSYPTYFHRVPFAHRGRPAGTTSRLDAWCQRLAKCISSKLVPPLVAAAVLRLTGVPTHPVQTQSASPAVQPGQISGYSLDRRIAAVADEEKAESFDSASSSSRASPHYDHSQAVSTSSVSVPMQTYFPAKYKIAELPHVEVPAARLSLPRLSQPGPSATDDVIAAVLDGTFDEEEDDSDGELADGGGINLMDCTNDNEELSSLALNEWPQACLEGTSTCTGGGPTDSDSSDSSEDSGHEGAARVGKALRQVAVGIESAPEGRSSMQRRMSERRKLVDPQAIM